MKVTEHIQQGEGTLFSFELLPPLKGSSIQSIYDTIDPLMEFRPRFINVTYHREELTYKKRTDGLLEPRIIRKRPGTVGIAAAIQNKYKIDVVPHIICGGFSKEETENALIDLDFLGIENLLIIRGDADRTIGRFIPNPDGHPHSIDLINQVKRMNKGQYLDEDLENSIPTNFSIGVAGYPEKHTEAPNMESDLYYLKKKIEAGAEYVVTQMFFDNTKYFDFVKLCRQEGIEVPIIPGLKPVSILGHLSVLPRTFNIDLPIALAKEIRKCKSNADVRELGVEWSSHQAKELKVAGAPVIHFYTMGRSDNIAKIAKAVF
ncbi:MAG: methylenetetrahydrofolate reductase [Bacteroidales bacterium]|nr:methylenetetrahydrofolate reductase [Bacteroidales bacterium]MCF8454421.1 methylenetetrahydrofolate reductase [Bacteroidales bacterium]